MTTVMDTPAPNPPGNDDGKDCSTRDLLEQIQNAVTEAKLQQEITNQKVTDLEEHLRQVQDYDTKITAAVDTYKQGIEKVRTGFDDLREAVVRGKDSYECLVNDPPKGEIVKARDAFGKRLETLETCAWDLRLKVIDKQCELNRANAEVERADKHLTELLALLTTRSAELEALKTLKDAIDGCAGTSTNQCRYAWYLDLVKRLETECISTEQYLCDLVDKVAALDSARQKATVVDGEVRVVNDQLDRVTKLRDELVAGRQEQLCGWVTRGIPALSPEIEKACTGSGASAA